MVTPASLTRRAELYYQIGNSISAGLPLVKALEMAAQNPSLRGSQKAIRAMLHYLREGHTLADTFHFIQEKKNPDGVDIRVMPVTGKFQIPEFDIALLSVGEETGRLDVTFKMLAKFYTDRAKIMRDTITSLILPALNLSVLLLVFPLGYLISFVIGIMDSDYRHCLPFIMQKTWTFALIYGSVFMLIYACQGTHGERWRAFIERIYRFIPNLRTALKFLTLGRFAGALEALVNAGVPVIRSWDMAARAAGSPRLKRQIQANINRLQHGLTPAEMANEISYFPDMFRNLYHTGEISGQIDDTLVRLRDYYQEEGIRKLQFFMNIFSKVVYFIIAIIAAIAIIRFYLGYFGAAMQAIQ